MPEFVPKGPVERLVVLLHGYGADGEDLIDIGRAFAGALPRTAFIAPHAPHPCGMGGPGREWFPLTFRDPNERWRGVTTAGPALDRDLDALLRRFGLAGEKLALIGFSQGTMMALHVALRRKVQPAAVLGYSGLLVGPSNGPLEAMKPEITARPPVLLVHGDADDVIPAQALFMSAQGLAALDVPTEWHLSKGVGHGIDEAGLAQGAAFLAARFAAAARPNR